MAEKEKVFITRKIPQEGIELLRQHFEVEIFKLDRIINKDELLEKAIDANYLLCLLTDHIDVEVIDQLNVKCIANYAVGYNNIDVEAASRKNIAVTNTPGVLTEATADLTWALMLALSRKILLGDHFIRAGKFEGWNPTLFLGGDFYNKKLGIIGLGRIGKAVARRAKGFGMNIYYYNRGRNKEAERDLGAKKISMEDLIKSSDYLSLHCPYTSETHHLIGKKELLMMKQNAYLINTARGKIIDEPALIEILKEKKIAGAALDVFHNEPKIPNDLKKLDNVVLTPHLGSASFHTRSKMAIMAAQNIIAVSEGKRPPNLINHEVSI